MRNICVVTGSRAEYGLLSGLMRLLKTSDVFNLQVITCAMHLSPKFGSTYREIEKDGFLINKKIEMLLCGDTPTSVAKSIGVGILGLADALGELQPDLVVILGDRYEILAAAQTAMMLTIPIAHIHGGEITEGAVDESIRHAITKMANLHFVANEQFKSRVIQMGEQPNRVTVCGAPGIDNIKNTDRISRAELESNIDFKLGSLNFLVSYHPVTLSQADEELALENLLFALDQYPTAKVIITYPNADDGGQKIIERIDQFAAERKNRVCLIKSLGVINYLNALSHVDLVIGNSSSGIIEAPSFSVPTVNVGERQKGRLKAESIIDCGVSEKEIITAIDHALSDSFKPVLKRVENPYGAGNAAEIIFNTLKTTEFSDLVRKPFHDLKFMAEP